jgi:hypothetical protein
MGRLLTGCFPKDSDRPLKLIIGNLFNIVRDFFDSRQDRGSLPGKKGQYFSR